MDQLSILALPLWETHVRTVLGIVNEALERLARHPHLPNEEPELNYLFGGYVREVNFERLRSGAGGIIWDPEYDAPPGPHGPGPQQSYQTKRPDLTWKLTDSQALTTEDSQKHYVVECKRLSTPSASGWDFILHYYTDGVLRFFQVGHSYGRNADCGVMVGYVQNMTLDAILASVNAHIAADTASSLPPIQGTLMNGGLSDLAHVFTRPIKSSPFTLRHRWVDLR
jgi:hypothetical protein